MITTVSRAAYPWFLRLSTGLAAMTLFLASSSSPADGSRKMDREDLVRITHGARWVAIQNRQVGVVFDLVAGTYDVIDRRTGEIGVAGAHAEVNRLATNAPGLKATWSGSAVRDALGKGMALRISAVEPRETAILFEVKLYEGSGFVSLCAGLDNRTGGPARLMDYRPMAGGVVFPAVKSWSNCKTLNGPSGALQTQVSEGPYRESSNNLLLTFRDGAARRSIVAGGLTYHEFVKAVSLSPDPSPARESVLSRQAKLAAYLDCGGQDLPATTGTARIRCARGAPYAFPAGITQDCYRTILFDEKEVAFDVAGLDPRKKYTLGFSWWDHNNDGRRESVWLVPAGGGERSRLLSTTQLPAFKSMGRLPEEKAIPVPPELCRSGAMRIAFTNDASAPNAVVSEIWLWEGAPRQSAPLARSAHPQSVQPRSYLQLRAWDPVGKLIPPHIAYVPDDRFYLDLTTRDPFVSAERYGNSLGKAQNAHPKPYDFPTVCAWYAGVWKTPGAQNNPGASKYRIATTPGLVEEAGKMRESGFLDYSRAAGRIVPDNYTPNNPQGWWDDEHWQKEGFYVAPYETSRKWGDAMRRQGALAFTYFQPTVGMLISRDFRETHTSLLLGKDPKRSLDYTNPDAQAHMRRVYSAMRGAISGMMFDYCDELWSVEAARGGFRDSTATATSFYRKCLQLAKEGLGPESWIHERAIEQPGFDIGVGLADSQRTSGDTDRIDAAMVSRSGLRWYKNRVVIAYDMDSKDLTAAWKVPGFSGTDTDGRRALLTMAYVAASRLLLANSFRDMSPEVLHDLERTFPYHSAARSARPVDAFVRRDWPQVYDFAVTPKWHELTLYNGRLPTREQQFSVKLSAAPADGGLGLNAGKQYHVYDFWNDRYIGMLKGSQVLAQKLRPGEARQLSVHEVGPGPQFISTNRHIMQGYVDLVGEPRWNARTMELSGASRVVCREPYKVIVATNGRRPAHVRGSAACSVALLPGGQLAQLTITSPVNAVVRWSISFARR